MVVTVRTTIWLICLLFLAIFAKTDIQSEYEVPISAYSVCASDIDMDGDLDLIVGHKTAWQHLNPTITLMKNFNHGIYTVFDTSKIFSGYQENIFAIDVNNDSTPDLVTFYMDFTSGVIKRYIRVFYNSGGTFQNFTDFPLNSSATFSDILYGNVDGLEGPDIIVSSNMGQFWGVLYNNGDGTFSAPVYRHLTNSYPTGLACGDLNNDGRDDVVVFGAIVHLYYSTGIGFNDSVLQGSFGYGKIEDFNNDGYRDIICYNDYSWAGTGISFFENTGNGQFIKHEEYLMPVSAYTAYSADFNNDGLSDILFPKDDYSGHIIYYNQGNFKFGDSVFISVPDYGEVHRKCCCADLDGNGYTDIVTVRNSYQKLLANLDIKFNNGKGQFIDQPCGLPRVQYYSAARITKIFPNPCTSSASIEIFLPEPELITVAVYDIYGELVKTIFYGNLPNGDSKVVWDITSGESYKSGGYFVILKSYSQLLSVQRIMICH